MSKANFIEGINNVNWGFPYGYGWIMLKLYILCLEHNVETSIIVPEIKNGILNINVNGLVPTEFLVSVHALESESIYVCSKCGMQGKYRSDIYGVYCSYHYILEKISRLRKQFLLNFK